MEQWVVAELNSRGEKEDPDTLRKSLRQVVKSEVFIPASVCTVGDDKVVRYLVEGYVFIQKTQPDINYFRLEGTKYIQSVLTRPSHVKIDGRSVRELSCIPSTEIERMRKQIRIETEQGIEVNDHVMITSGAYKGIDGYVIEEIPEKDSVQVHIKLRSKEAIITLPRSFLRLERKKGITIPTPYSDAAFSAREWYNKIRNVLIYKGEVIQPLSNTRQRWDALNVWADRALDLQSQVDSLYYDFNLTPILRKFEEFSGLDYWVERGSWLGNFIDLLSSPDSFPNILKKSKSWNTLVELTDRLISIGRQVDLIENALTTGPDMIQNIVIDGHNLAMRCFHAPGMESLSSKGRPTGMINGFLRSLNAYRKRFPNADFWVCWDGSSQHRKTLFADYKAKRPVGNGESFNQFIPLAEILPSLGVNQVTNPREESDDLIATLVRGPLQGQRNVIISNDQDFMQLVTPTDVVLVPKVGPRPERFFDESAVLEEYGVEPSMMVHLRALQGDTSDNIPGVPRVPNKVLMSLLKTFRTIEGIYDSSLPGLTKLQYEKIRAAEKQVKLNVTLMQLRDVEYIVQEGVLDQGKLEKLLGDLDIQLEPFLTPFFSSQKGFSKTG